MSKHVLFICIFNVKRSVVAQHILRTMLVRKGGDYASRIEVSSAGYVGREIDQWFQTKAIPYPDPLFNRSPSQLIQEIMRDRGMDLSGHLSRPVDEEILRRSHLIIPMLTPLKSDLIASYPEIEDKVVLPNELLENDAPFLWEDTDAVPNDRRMFDFVHGNRVYVTNVINEIEEFLQKSCHRILQFLFRSDLKNLKK